MGDEKIINKTLCVLVRRVYTMNVLCSWRKKEYDVVEKMSKIHS